MAEEALALCLCFSGLAILSKTGGYTLAITTTVFGTIRSILIVTWGLSSLSTGPVPSYEEYKEKYYMPAMEKHADCDAQADYSKFLAFQSQSSNDGLIWLDFASQIILVIIGTLLLVFIMCCPTGVYRRTILSPIIVYGFIFLLIASMIMEIVAFAVFYPGRLLSPNTGFGLTSVILFPFKYLVMLAMCQWLFIGGENPGADTSADGRSSVVIVDDQKIPEIPVSEHGSEFKKSLVGTKADYSISRHPTARRNLEHPSDTYGVRVNVGDFMNSEPGSRSPLIQQDSGHQQGNGHEYPFERERRMTNDKGYRYSDRR